CCSYFFLLMHPPPPRSTLFPYTTLFRSNNADVLRLISRGDIQQDFIVNLSERRIPSYGAHGNKGSLIDSDHAVNGSRRIFVRGRSEEHTSELQSRGHLVCRLLLEKKNKE